MHKGFVIYGLAAGMLIGLSLSGAQAAATRPMSAEALGLGPASTPVAMCGYSCRRGGRYIPGPPSVCYEEGLNFCGPSRRWGGPPRGPGYDGGGPYGRGPRPYGGGGYGGGRGPGRGPNYGQGPGPSRGGYGGVQGSGQAPQGNPYGQRRGPSGGGEQGSGQASQGNPYGQGPGRCGSGLC